MSGHIAPDFIPLRPENFADEYDPWFGLDELATTPERRLLVETLKGGIADARGDVVGEQCSDPTRQARMRSVAKAWARIWLASEVVTHWPTVSMAFICEVLELDQASILRRLDAGLVTNLRHLRSGGSPQIHKMRRRQRWDRRQKKMVLA